MKIGEREMRAGNFPIGIDANAFARSATTPEVEERLRSIRDSYRGRQIVLGLDRLDYTKGIPERLQAFADLLQRFPEVRGRIHLAQVVIPSREGIPEYDGLRLEIERLVGRINGLYGELGWTPVHYLYRSLSTTELLAFLPCGRYRPYHSS